MNKVWKTAMASALALATAGPVAAQTYGTATSTGNSATNALTSAITSANQSVQTAGQGFNTAISGNNSAGSLMDQQYQGQLQASQSGIGSLLAGAGGIGMGLGSMGVKFSDKNMKEDIAPIDDDKALDGIKKTNVKRWKYKSGSPGDDGGQPHMGAMAQDMQKNLGDTVAPGGKMVDIISALGTNMAATKALAKQVDRLEHTVKKGVRQ